MGRLFNATEPFEADGQTFTLAIDIEIIDAIEDELNNGFIQIMAEMGSGNLRIGKMSRVVRGLLARHHPKITLNEAGSLLVSDGDVLNTALENLFAKAWPDAAGTKGENPPIARRGTGKRSTSSGARKTSRQATSSARPLELSS
jgi:hypothetical protein